MVGLILDHVKFIIRQGNYREENKLSVDFLDDLGRTPLFNACYYGHTEIVQLFMDFYHHHSSAVSMDMNIAVKNSQRTPLHVAVKRGSSDIVRILLSSKEIDLNLQAKPSKDTHKHLIRAVQKKLHGRVMPSYSITEEDDETARRMPNRSENVLPETPPPISMTPVSSSSTSWSNIPSPVSGSMTPDTREAISPPPQQQQQQQQQKKNSLDDRRFTGASSPPSGLTSPVDRNAFTVPKQHPPFRKSSSEEHSGPQLEEGVSNFKKRTQTNVVLEDSSGTAIAVYENSSKQFEILMKGTYSGHTVFDHVFMTALAEACVYNRQSLIIMLLKHGARDESGLACRIAHLAQRPELVQLILAHHCVLGERKSVAKKVHQKQTNDCLRLEWSSLKLVSCESTLFTNPSVYYPSRQNGDQDFDTGYSTKPREARTLCRVQTVIEQSTRCIAVVNLDYNRLTEVPLSMFQLENVAEINIAYNQISRLPESTDQQGHDDFCGWQCAELDDLNVSHNVVTILPSCVWILPSLKHLCCSHNKLEYLLPEPGKMVREELLTDTLLHIDFASNSLASLPQFLFKFPHLRSICLQHNALRTLPETLWLCRSLQELNVAHNKLTCLPWCEPERTMMESQNEPGNDRTKPMRQFDKIVAGHAKVCLGRSTSVFNRQQSTVHIAALGGTNELAWDIPLNALEGCDYSSLTKLDLSYNNLELFPEALPCLAPNLIEIDVSNNSFREIDIQFIPPCVKKFFANRCNIERFGNTITEALRSQVVKNCRHPDTFATPCQHRNHHRLPALTKLSLSSNKLRYLQLVHHSSLTREGEDAGQSEVEFNQRITSLDLLYPALETLDLTLNNLQGLFNPNIGHQSHLKSIRLDKNYDLERLPMEFAYLKNSRLLTELSRKDLPKLNDPPKEYQDVSLNHLLAYMRSRLKE